MIRLTDSTHLLASSQHAVLVLIVEDDKDDGGRAELPGFAFDERERAVLNRRALGRYASHRVWRLA